MVKLGMSCIKYLLFVFNLLFVVGGLFLIVVGVIIKVKGMTIFGDTTYVSMPIIICITGVAIFLLAFLGCCGAIRESIFKLSIFGILLIIVLVCQMAAIVVGFLHREQMDAFIRHSMKKSLAHQKRDMVSAWDKMQVSFQCCGVEGPKDYAADKLDIPKSCCKSGNKTDSKTGNKTAEVCSESKAYETGCYMHLVGFIFKNFMIFGGIGGTIAIVELVSVVFTFCLVSAIRGENKARAPPPPRSPYRY